MGTLQKIALEPTRSTPAVTFDPAANRLHIRGQSYPENAFTFYQPLLEWIDEYLEGLTPDVEVQVELQLPYINTTSTKCLLMLLEKLDEAYRTDKKVAILWLYDEDNESELECAEEFKEDLSLPFQIVPKTSEQ